MSYILDALRKADAQRERDPSRGIHAQPVQPLPSQIEPHPGRRLWLWGIAVLVVGGVLAWAGWSFTPSEPLVVVAPPTAPTPAPASRPETPDAASPAPATALFPAAAPPAPVPVPAVREAARAPAVTAYPPVASASAAGRVPSLAELPADVQREIPKLDITGGVYSPVPAQRLLIVNGLVLNEGTEAAPGVRLEQIRPKLAVLVYRGYRYGVPY